MRKRLLRKIKYLSLDKFHKKQGEYSNKLVIPINRIDENLANKGIQNFVTRDTIYAVK